MHPDLESLVTAGKLPAPAAEKLSLLEPGTYCLHPSWGPGKIAGWDVDNDRVRVDFEGKDGHELKLEFAAKSLSPLVSTHVLAMRVADRAAMTTMAEKQAAEVKKAAAAAAAANAKVEEGSSAGRDSLNKCLFDELHFLLRACRDYELTATEEKCGNAAVVENRRRDEVNLICLCIFYRCLCDDSAVSVAFFFDRSSRATLTKSNDILKKGESKRGAAADLWQLAALHGPPECNHVLFLSIITDLSVSL
jgi:hypothetical protein